MIIINNIGHGLNSHFIALLAVGIYLMIFMSVILYLLDKNYIPLCKDYIYIPIGIFFIFVIPLIIMAIILK